MNKTRLEAFSDGVLAIIITIMVLELRPPSGQDLAALGPMAHSFISYALSFIFVGIYWSNHHHMIQAAERVSGGILWANLHLLFWLSLIPFATAWMGKHQSAPWPVAVYGMVLLLSGVAYFILARALGSDLKGKLSLAIYAAAIRLAFVRAWLAYLLYVAVALMWLLPDRRFEKARARA